MADTLPNKIYKYETNGSPYYEVLPATNVPSGHTEINPNQAQTELQGLVSKFRSGNVSGFSADQWSPMADFYQKSLDSINGMAPKSNVIANYTAPGGEVLTNTNQQAIDSIEANKKAADAGTMRETSPGVYIPIGTPGDTLQKSPSQYAAQYGGEGVPGFNPPGTYQEVKAAQYPGNDLSSKYQDAFDAAKTAGVTSPSDASSANDLFNTYLPSNNSGASSFVSSDPYLNSVISTFQQYMSHQSQQKSLVDTYNQMLQDSGIQGIDTQLLNLSNIMNGTEDDIRNEITKAGGFSTESQVQALVAARNKTLIKQYQALQATRDSKQQYLDTMVNLTEKDRAAADQHFDTMMNYETKIADLQQKMQANAIDSLSRTAQTIGWDGVYQAAQGNPKMVAQIERTYGLPSGGLALAAQRDAQIRASQASAAALDTQYKQTQINKMNSDIPTEQERALSLQDKQLGLQLKAEQIKTEQAQRSKIYADVQKLVNEQKGTVLDPKTAEGAKQLATMKSQVDLISGLTKDKNLSGAVGPNSFARFSPIASLSGGKSNFIAGVEQMRSGLNLNALIDAKSRGATFGALSDQELQVLANTASKIGTWAIKDKNGNVSGYNANEKNFKTELDKINNFAKLDYIYRGGDVTDVGVQVINGKYYTKNSDGTVTEL